MVREMVRRMFPNKPEYEGLETTSSAVLPSVLIVSEQARIRGPRNRLRRLRALPPSGLFPNKPEYEGLETRRDQDVGPGVVHGRVSEQARIRGPRNEAAFPVSGAVLGMFPNKPEYEGLETWTPHPACRGNPAKFPNKPEYEGLETESMTAPPMWWRACFRTSPNTRA